MWEIAAPFTMYEVSDSGEVRNSGAYPTVYDALLDWLRGDA